MWITGRKLEEMDPEAYCDVGTVIPSKAHTMEMEMKNGLAVSDIQFGAIAKKIIASAHCGRGIVKIAIRSCSRIARQA